MSLRYILQKCDQFSTNNNELGLRCSAHCALCARVVLMVLSVLMGFSKGDGAQHLACKVNASAQRRTCNGGAAAMERASGGRRPRIDAPC